MVSHRHPSDVRVLFLGCGDLGTGAAHRLFTFGFQVLAVELDKPLAVRRRVVFAEAVRSGEIEVEGVVCRRMMLRDAAQQKKPWEFVPVFVESPEDVLTAVRPHAVVDARMAKRVLGPAIPSGLFVVTLGPGHAAGRDCDLVIETLRGPELGAIIREGSARPDTGTPGDVGGATLARVLRAPASGTLVLQAEIGDWVGAGQILATVCDLPVRSGLEGRIRGLLPNGDWVQKGQKLGDVDPRQDAPGPERISDKAHVVGESVLTAIRERFGF